MTVSFLLSPIILLILGHITIPNVDSVTCCNTPHPIVRIWIEIVPPTLVNYTFYDLMGQMKKMWAYEVDESGTLLENRKIFEANTTSLLCPLGYKSNSPHHDELTTSWPSRTLCLQENLDAKRSLKPNKWYVICQEYPCRSCYLDKMINSQRHIKFIDVESAVIKNDTFTARLTVLEPGMRYNVSLEPNYVQPAILNLTIDLNQKNAVIDLPHVNQTIGPRSAVILRVKPWVWGDTLPCAVVPDVQFITLYQSDLRRLGSS